MEDICQSYISKERLKTTLKAFVFIQLDIFAFLKPDKGKGIVLIIYDDCINSLRKIFDDSTKFKKVAKDPTITRLTV